MQAAVLDERDENLEPADPAVACAEYLVELQNELDQAEEEKRVATAWMLRHLLMTGRKPIDLGTHVIRLKKMTERLSPRERRHKRAATMFWHPGADPEFYYVSIEKKRGVA